MPRLFHVTSVLNRDSIMRHGLDWTRMGAAPGIAGSRRAEGEGVFLCLDESEIGFFVRMNNTGDPVDVWAAEEIDEQQLITTGSGCPSARERTRRTSPPATPTVSCT